MVKSPAGAPPERRDQPGGSWPPGPKGLPFLGNLLEFRRDALRYYSEWSRQYGDIVALRLGVWPAVLLNHSDHAEYVNKDVDSSDTRLVFAVRNVVRSMAMVSASF